VLVFGTEAEIVLGARQEIFETEGVFLLVFRFFLFLLQALVDSVFDGAFGVSVSLESDFDLIIAYDARFDFGDIQVIRVFVVIIAVIRNSGSIVRYGDGNGVVLGGSVFGGDGVGGRSSEVLGDAGVRRN